MRNLSVSELLTKLKADSARERRIEREARDRAEGYEAGIAYLEAILPPTPSENGTLPGMGRESSGDEPRGEAAILAVVREEPARDWATAEIHRILEDRKWITPGAKHPRAGVEAALSRLVKKGSLLRIDKGVYHVPYGEGAIAD